MRDRTSDAGSRDPASGARPGILARGAAYVRRHHVGLIAIVVAASAGATATALPTEPVPVLSINGSAVPGTTGGAGRVVQAETAKAKILPFDKPGPGDIDTDAMHSFTVTPEKFVIMQPGVYEIYARVEWLPGNGVGDRTFEYREAHADGSPEYVSRLAKNPAHTYNIEQQGQLVRRLSAGDSIRISARQTSGETLGVLGRHISIVWVGP